MASAIKSFLEHADGETKKRVYRGIEDFCYNNTAEFKSEFVNRIGNTGPALAIVEDPALEDKFVDALTAKDGECIFLLKDTHRIFNLYQKKTNKGFGLLINRSFFGHEEIYFELIDLVYKSLEGVKDSDTFLERYFQNFRVAVKDKLLGSKSLEVFEYIKTHTTGPIIWVDVGFQFTFSLFCYASVRLHSENSIKQDLYNFSIYPWLADLFTGKYFTTQNEPALPIELRGINSYYSSLQKNIQGAITGFAIGDSLGFPVAGISADDIGQFIDLPIKGFEENKKHPYFDTLNAGQYTHNTNLFLISLKQLIRDGDFSVGSYVNDLATWGKDNLGDKDKRWLGPTASKGIENLIAGISYAESGSRTTRSCSALYRTLPLALLYQPLKIVSQKEFIEFVTISAGITHNSVISKTAAVIATLVLRDVVVGVMPLVAIESALKVVEENEETKPLIEKIRKAIEMSGESSDDEARKYFGTGSPVYQTLPLSIFFFLKYQDDFNAGILAAANSFRVDTEEEKQRLAGTSWEEQLVLAEGGNTDGIAAITGAFLGTRLGVESISDALKKVEGFESIQVLAFEVIKENI